MATIQKGELTETLRQFFNVAGSLKLALDENVFPVVVASHLDQPPYRVGAVNFAKRCSQGAVALNLSAAGLHLPRAAAGAARITGVFFESTAIGQQSSLFYHNDAEALTAYSLQGGAVDVERPGPSGATTLRLTPVREFFAAAAAVPSGTSERLALCSFPTATESKYMPCDVLLYPGYGLAVWNQTVNQGVAAAFFGTYYPDASQ